MLYVPDPQVIDVVTLLVTIIAPIVVGLITKASTSSATKAWLLAAVAALVGIGNELIKASDAGGAFDVWDASLTAITTFVVAVALHYGLWKPATVTERVQAIGNHD